MKIAHVSDNIITIDDFLTEEECLSYIDLSEKTGYEMAKLDTGKVVQEIRNNDRVLYESLELADELFQKAQPFLIPAIGNSILVGLNELFRFYKYQKGQKFKGHQDGNYIRNKKEASYYTFMIYLNEGYQGGETTFLKHKIIPKRGMGLVFLHKLYHEGSEVIEGIKYVLRTDVMYRLKEESKNSDFENI